MESSEETLSIENVATRSLPLHARKVDGEPAKEWLRIFKSATGKRCNMILLDLGVLNEAVEGLCESVFLNDLHLERIKCN
jgi:hypothetical protein